MKDEDKAEAINGLLGKSRVDVAQNEAGVLVYRYIDEEEALRLKELLPEEVMIYRLIEESGNKGLWINDIKKKAGANGGKLGKPS